MDLKEGLFIHVDNLLKSGLKEYRIYGEFGSNGDSVNITKEPTLDRVKIQVVADIGNFELCEYTRMFVPTTIKDIYNGLEKLNVPILNTAWGTRPYLDIENLFE